MALTPLEALLLAGLRVGYSVLLVSAIQESETVIILYTYPLPLEPPSSPPCHPL